MKYLMNWLLTLLAVSILYYPVLHYCNLTANWGIMFLIIPAIAYLQWPGFAGRRT